MNRPKMVKWVENFFIDCSKVRCYLTQDELVDKLWLSNVFKGNILTNKLYPLIFDEENKENERSLIQLETFLESNLASELIPSVMIGVAIRDLFLAHSFGNLQEKSKESTILKKCLEKVENNDSFMTINDEQNIQMSFFPTKTFSVVRLVENKPAIFETDSTINACFASVFDNEKMNHHRFVFLRPDQLSYHNFENIIRLDEWFKHKNCPDSFKITNVDCHYKQNFINFELKSCDILEELINLDVFATSPVNTQQRGGKRCIFSSNALSNALSTTIKNNTKISNFIQNDHLNFEFVNYVFRFNKFEPNDHKFSVHYDTPYYDARRKHVSRYTLIIYLTKGIGHEDKEPLILNNKCFFAEIDKFECFIFDQKLPHEGNPFVNSTKVFIRTELIFGLSEDFDKSDFVKLKHSNEVAINFAIANYLVGHSLLDQSLEKFANEAYEIANKLHFSIIHNSPKEKNLLMLVSHKQIPSFRFATNGYDYFFAFNCHQLEIFQDVKVCAIFAIIDYFNCGFGSGQRFKQVSTSTIINPCANDGKTYSFADEIFAEIKTSLLPCEKHDATEPTLLKFNNFSQVLDHFPILKRTDYVPEEQEVCCPFHDVDNIFQPKKSGYLIGCYEKDHKTMTKKLENSSFFILGDSVCVNNLEIVIQNDLIFVNDRSGKKLKPINFASCWNVEISDYVQDKDINLYVPDLLIPPIRFQKMPNGYHLMIDFWKNDWMIEICNNDDELVSLPILSGGAVTY
jgi:hypothetical protein